MRRYNKTSLNKTATLEIISPYNAGPFARSNQFYQYGIWSRFKNRKRIGNVVSLKEIYIILINQTKSKAHDLSKLGWEPPFIQTYWLTIVKISFIHFCNVENPMAM